ncbi:hypothetical protein [Streptomyces sp. GS7]|uniref:hypothetical protein n=1 Tax=Streptomyces sp. GS7 TaxID=2692234 RepID=UPI0013174475|nr:hypothetical protein [Streptomyces sp. GS7]QHC26450.1 hypothetical protein GR130_38865 [Streptomyces sp. GS7]
MSGDFHFGDRVEQYGDHNTGIIKNQGPTDPRSAFRDMIATIQVLRNQVPAEDREIIDESLRAIGTGQDVPHGTLRRALTNISGVATMIGAAGVPVIESVRRVIEALGN